MLMNFGTLAPVGGKFACPLCLPPIPGFNPFFGKIGKIPPFPGFNPFFGKIPPFPGLCPTCV